MSTMSQTVLTFAKMPSLQVKVRDLNRNSSQILPTDLSCFLISQKLHKDLVFYAVILE